MTTEHLSEIETRLLKRESLIQNNINPYQYNFIKSHKNQEIIDKYHSIEQDHESSDIVTISGRIIAKRGHGKAGFVNLLDESATMQLYANVNQLGEDKFNFLMELDLGDIIGITGVPFRTKRGELSIKLMNFQLLTKALLPLPEKYHGLQDKELRYRKRYLDLISNKEVRDTFKSRSDIVRSIRHFLEKKDFMEVETPVLSNTYGGASARPFTTHHNDLKQDLFLRISLELPLKRLIIGGYEKIYEIGRVFRNEGVSYKHNPEYTLLELYQAFADYSDMMKLTEELLSQLAFERFGSTKITYQGKDIDLTPPFNRLTFSEALIKYTGVTDLSQETLYKKALELGLTATPQTEKSTLIMLLYDKCVEPQLIQPTFMMDHPWETSPLAKRHRSNPELVERFELIVNGMELANAFSELNDPIDQAARFEEQEKARNAGDDEAHLTDDEFVEALKYGMPPTGGLGLGIDRIVMLLTDSHSIRDVLFFPHMKDK